MATNYEINYDDERFQNVEAEKQAQLSQMGNAYNDMINNSDQFYDDQKNAIEDYKNTQTQLQQQQTDFAIQKIEQEKDKTLKDYTKEQKGAYVDYQKASNQYGANAEQMATQGLMGSGFSESSQVSMFNTYQNRVSTAREVYNQAILNYNNSIQEARLNNNSKLAEIAYNSLRETLSLSLEAFQYKNTLVLDKMDREQDINNTYYQRWQDVQSQINTENQFKEQIRQYDEQLAYYKAKDEREYQLEIQKLEEQKRQAQQAQANWEKEFALQQKQVNASLARSSGSSGGSTKSATLNNTGNKNATLDNTGGNTKNYTSAKENGIKNLTTKEYNNLRDTTRVLYNATKFNGTDKAVLAVKNHLAASKASEVEILSILKSLGIK
jgi:hypothetical protein